MKKLISDVADTPAFEATDGSRKIIRFLVDAEETPLRKLHSGLTVIPAGCSTVPVRPEREEIFFILEGRGEFLVGAERSIVEPLTVVVAPWNEVRQATALDEPLTYLWVSSDPPATVPQKRTWRPVEAPIPGRTGRTKPA